MVDIRCSRLPLLSKCAAAQSPPSVRVERDDSAARLGTAVHDCLAFCVQNVCYDVGIMARCHNVDAEELRTLAAMGEQCWEQVRQHFPAPTVEEELRHADDWGVLTGHPDVFSVHDGWGWVCDFKTGREDEDYSDQMRGYALLMLANFENLQGVRVCVIRVRDRTADWSEYHDDEISHWYDDLRHRLRDGAEVYRPGRHCGYCPRFHECPGAASHLTLASEFLLTADKAGCSPLGFGPDRQKQVAYTYDRVRLLESVCESVREEIRAEVRRAGGVLPTGDGRELVITHQERKAIDYRPAYAVLRSTLGLDRLESLLRVSLSDASEAVREHAPRGQKAKAVTELKGRLEEAGALNVTTVERLECRRAVKHIESE